MDRTPRVPNAPGTPPCSAHRSKWGMVALLVAIGIPAPGVGGAETYPRHCTAPATMQWVSTACDPANGSAATAVSNCTEPRAGQYVKTVCLPGNATSRGENTGISACAEPGNSTMIYVERACVTGTPTTMGQNTTIASCTLPDVRQFVVDLCRKGDANSTGANTVVASCSEPAPMQWVSTICGTLHRPGSDTVINDCAAPAGGYFVTRVCEPGTLMTEGKDTITSTCAQPGYQEYVTRVCEPGTPITLGTNTTTSTCAQPGDQEYVTGVCDRGTPMTLGTNTTTSTCAQPGDQEYVTRVCDRGTPRTLGTNTNTSTCAQPGDQEYVIRQCRQGSWGSAGADTVVAPCAQPTFERWVTKSCTPGSAFNFGEDTAIEDCERPGYQPYEFVHKYVSDVCLRGSSTHSGVDTTLTACVEPTESQWVLTACDLGAPESVGANTAVRSCAVSEDTGYWTSTGTYVIEDCKRGDAIRVGADTVLGDCDDNVTQKYGCPFNNIECTERCEGGGIVVWAFLLFVILAIVVFALIWVSRNKKERDSLEPQGSGRIPRSRRNHPASRSVGSRGMNLQAPEASHVFRRWWDCGSQWKMCFVLILVVLAYLVPLIIGAGCVQKSWSMGYQLVLVAGSDYFEREGDLQAQSADGSIPVLFVDECQAFTEGRRYCSGLNQRWKNQNDGTYACSTKNIVRATFSCAANIRSIHDGRDRHDWSGPGKPPLCVLALNDASYLYTVVQSRLLVAGLLCWVSISPGCLGPCWAYNLMDRKSSSHCMLCECCEGWDYRSKGDRAAGVTRELAGWCLFASLCSLFVIELLSIL